MSLPDFRLFRPSDTEACLAIFDQNCPEHFAPNERIEFAEYLRCKATQYWLYEREKEIVGAFGLWMDEDTYTARINWIMVRRICRGHGIGSMMMQQAVTRVRNHPGIKTISISASQHSAPFFTCFGAIEKSFHEHGWGPGMHRVEMELPL